VNFSIDNRPFTNRIPLGFANDIAGNYTISLMELAQIAQVQLEDTKENHFHDLMASDYVFDWDISDEETRFVLHLSATGIQSLGNEQISIYSYKDNIYIKGNLDFNEAQVSIYDLQARLIHQELASGNLTTISCSFAKGAYVVEVISDNFQKREKIIIP